MHPGLVVAERFKVERHGRAGGMGQIYRALDLHTGAAAALKVLRPQSTVDRRRLLREAEILSSYRHPGIVRYLAHGETDEGDMYLAMEWLMGETLAERLAQRGLSVAESVALAVHVADALGELHGRGVVHRDLKPSNVFLRGGSHESPVLIDFGIARLLPSGPPLTAPGAMMGTPGYMAPEQVRGEADVDTRADVFALGCVIFKCLAGRPPFEGDDALGVLFRVVVEDPPTLSELRPGLPPALSDLVSRMLSKSRDARPEDGARVAFELSDFSQELDTTVKRVDPFASLPEITSTERRLMCLVMVSREDASGEPPRAGRAEAGETASVEALRALAKRHEGRLERLADGSTLIVLTSAEAATDLAARAARCALGLAPLVGDAAIAIVSGRAVLAERLPLGELIDKAVTLLAWKPRQRGEPAIRLDPVTLGLLGARFQVSADADGAYLHGELRALEATRTLLGRPTPCVGRERELSLLTSIVARSIEEGMAGAVLVIAAAGIGKSRLCHELLQRLQEHGDPASIWMGAGNPLASGSAFGLLSQALRSALGINEGEPLEDRQRTLSARVRARFADPAAAAQTLAFLGELMGTPFADDDVKLRAARRDPVLMGDQMRRAWEDFLAAECAVKPVLLLLEDLHWGDLPTVKFIDAALRKLRDAPLVVLAFARPEVAATFPDLWVDRPVQTIQLRELGRKAAEQLCRHVLHKGVSDEAVKSIVDRASGNAFYLEELIRAAADGQSDAPPETVLSMLQARLEGLDAEARRILRAASVFGKTFWEGGVSALLGGLSIAGWLRSLESRELIFARGDGGTKFRGEAEYSFRHALVHEAAYGMLTERDRAMGHKLAAEWLERTGERDAGLLGEHFERGRDLDRSIAWYRRAAEQALEGNAYREALRWAARSRSGIERREGATARAEEEEELGRIHQIEAEAHRLLGEVSLAEPHALAAERLLPRGSEAWFGAIAEVVILHGRLGRTQELIATGGELCKRWSPEATSGQIIATAWSSLVLVQRGEYALADELIARLLTVEAAAIDPQARARILLARAIRSLVFGDAGRHRDLIAAAVEQFIAAGDRRNAASTQVGLGFAEGLLGLWEEAAQKLREALAVAERMGLPTLSAYAHHNLGFALARSGALADARAAEIEAIERCTAQGNTRLAGGSRIYLAMILAELGEPEAAEEEATRAIEGLSDAPPLAAYALSTRARVRLGRGRAAEALADAEMATRLLSDLGGLEEGEAQVLLTHAEALHAAGDALAARSALMKARARLLSRADKIADPVARRSFLERVPEHRRTMELAEALGIDGPGPTR